MRIGRSTPLATAEQLRQTASKRRTKIAEMKTEHANIRDCVAELVGDPAHEEAENRLAELDVLIPVEERILARIEAAIPVAEERERRTAFLEKRADLDRRTEKLVRRIRRDYPPAAASLAELLNEMRANEREWDALRDQARDLGEQGIGHSAEYRARGELAGARQLGVFKSILLEAVVPAWSDPRPLFQRPRS